MEKINISFINYGGLSYGGAHKQSMGLAKTLNKDLFNVRYFWCKHNLDKYSDFSFPEQNLNFLQDLKDSGVEVTEFQVGFRDISDKHHVWRETNFFEIFNRYQTDLIFSVRSGRSEFPTIHINKPFIEWNVFGSADKESNNLIYSVGVSPWVLKTHIKNGGSRNNSGYCFHGLEEPQTHENMRNQLGITTDQIVIGFHQRNDDNIFSETAMRSWANISIHSKKDLYFIVLGGSQKYKRLAAELKINVHFLPVVFDTLEVSKFLNTLDIFSHSAGAGESLGIAVQEAMIHKLPIVSMYGQNNGHIDVIGSTIEIAHNQKDYDRILLKLVNDKNERMRISALSYKRAENEFSVESMGKYFEELFISKYNEHRESNFKVINLSIYSKISPYSILYRFIYKFPTLMKIVSFLYLKIKRLHIIKNLTS